MNIRNTKHLPYFHRGIDTLVGRTRKGSGNTSLQGECFHAISNSPHGWQVWLARAKPNPNGLVNRVTVGSLLCFEGFSPSAKTNI